MKQPPPSSEPGPPANGRALSLMLGDEIALALDLAARGEPDHPQRGEMVRRILADWLRGKGLIGQRNGGLTLNELTSQNDV